MSAMFKLIEHTADMGIEAHAESLSRIFEEVAQGLTAMIYADSTASPEISRSITLQADNKEELLVAWLNEILYWIDSDNIIPAGFEIDSLSDTELTASVVGECFDNQRHIVDRQVKSVTYHQLSLEENDDGWLARVYVDL